MNWYLNYFANNDEYTAELHFSLLSILQKRRGPYLPVGFSTSRLFFYAEMHMVLSFQSVVTEVPDLLK